MKNHKILASLIFLLISFSVFAAEKGGLMGEWACQGDGGASTLVFKNANTLIYDGESNTYRLQGDAIMVPGDWGEEAYRYSLKGNRLKVTFPEGDVISCKRVPAGKKEARKGAGANGGNAQLRGRLCQWSGSSSSYSGSSYSRTAKIEFDGQGNALYSSESSYSGNAGMAYGNSGGTRGRYQVTGDQVRLQLEDGSDVVAQVNMRQNDGRITELMANGKLWATGLCE